MVKHYREGKVAENFGGVRVKSISERHHQKIESLVNCHQSKMSVKIAIGVEGGGGANSKSLFKRGHSVKTPGKKKLTTSAKYLDDDKDNYSSSESSYSSYSDQDSPPQKRSKKSHQKKPNRFIKNVTKKKSDSKRKQDKKLEKEEDEEYVVESIVDMRKDKDGKRYFFVKWENYDSSENTWEPIENLEKCHDIIEEFLKMRRNNNKSDISTDDDDNEDDDDESTGEDEDDESDDKGANDDNGNKLSDKKPEKGIICRNGITLPDVTSIKASMISSAQKVVDVDPLSCATTPSCSELSDEYYSDDGKGLDDLNDLGPYIQISQTGNVFYFRIIDDGNGELNWIYLDVDEPQPEKEVFYRCIVTEDLTGKEPKFIFGATTSIDGETFCLVQFEGHSYVEVIPPEILFLRFPSFRKFFEVHCPNLFQKNTQ